MALYAFVWQKVLCNLKKYCIKYDWGIKMSKLFTERHLGGL